MTAAAAGKQIWPADRVERRSVAELVPYARNARKHSDEQVDQIVASILEFGWTVAVLIDPDGLIIAGHGRVLAAQRLGLKEVPVIVALGWTEAQKRAYTIADNKLALNASWDDQLLVAELSDLKAADFDLALVGFSEPELAALFAPSNPGLTDPDEVPDVQAKAIARAGDVWLLGRHRLACGDSTDQAAVTRALGAAKPHLMVTDPPYGVEYDPAWRRRVGINEGKGKQGKVANDHRADWTEAWRLFAGDVAYIWHAGVHAAEVARSIEAAGFTVRAQIIWAKDRMVLSRGHYHWQHEPCWYAVRNGATGHWSGDRSQTTLWTIPAREDSGHGHGTQKPVECMRRAIENNSRTGDVVYDPFVGSFTTGIACEMTGRSCIALEVSPNYVDVGIRRWQTFCGGVARLEGDGRSFDEIAAERTQQREAAEQEEAEAIAHPGPGPVQQAGQLASL